MPQVARSLVILTANQAAGIDPILAANQNRTTMVLGNATATDGTVDVAPIAAGEGMPFSAKTILAFGGDGAARGSGGPVCPTNDVYVCGFAAGDKITVWVA